MQTIVCDTRQKLKHHELKEGYFKRKGIKVLRSKLPCGDYANIKDLSVCIDTKQNIQEAIGNICGKQHIRFRNECTLAKESGIKLIILIEDPSVKCIADLYDWENPRAKLMKYVKTEDGKKIKVPKYPKATSGMTLARAMQTMQIKYGVKFLFCHPNKSGYIILKMLKLL